MKITPARRATKRRPGAEMHPRCRCVLTTLDPLPPRSLWQRFKDWRSRRRADRMIRGLYADLVGPE